MRWDIDVRAEDGIVRVTAVGAASVMLLKKMSAEAIETARGHQLNKLLADGREMTLPVSAVRLYDLPKVLEMQGLTRLDKMAMLWSGDPEQQDAFTFLETIFINRGFQARLFRDDAEAVRWLKALL